MVNLVVKTHCIGSLQKLSAARFLLAHVASVANPLLVGLPVLRLGELSTVEVLWGLSQKALSLKVDSKRLSILQDQMKEPGTVREAARLASQGLHHAGSWLMVTPTRALGLHLQSTAFVIAVKYRLGCQV